MEIKNDLLNKLLIQYDLNESELEVYYPGANELLLSKQNDDEMMLARLVRVVATNKALVQRGLPSLGNSNDNIIKSNDDTKNHHHNNSSSITNDDDTILTPNERRILEQCGGGGLVLGIPLGHLFYWRCIAKCRSKRSRKLAKENPNAFKLLILRYIKNLAKEELRRESLGLTRAHNTETAKHLFFLQKQQSFKTDPSKSTD